MYFAFILAVALLVMIPGPNVALIVGNSIGHGTRAGLLTVAGTSAAAALLIGLTALGMTAALDVLAAWFDWIRWIGVAYLVWLGVRAWRAEPQDLSRPPVVRGARSFLGRGFAVGMTNPKTILFYGAFLPQFIAADAPVGPQMLRLGIGFVVVATLGDSIWAALAGRARFLLARRGRLRNRLTGGLLIGAGLGLVLARRS
jgi:threonine/homoserine/homoserine lactone efflux protein